MQSAGILLFGQLVTLLLILVHNGTALTLYSNTTTSRSYDHISVPSSSEISKGSGAQRLGSFILQGLDNEHTTVDAPGASTGLGSQRAITTVQTSRPGTVTSKASYSLMSFTSPDPMRSDVWNMTSSITEKPDAVSKARKCWSDIMTWSSSSAAWWNEQVANRSWPMTTTETPDYFLTSWKKTIYPSQVSTYRLCDGTPRVNARPTTLSSTFNTTQGTITRTVPATPTFRPQPCDPSPQDCHIWYDDSSIPVMNDDALLEQCGNPAHGTNGPCVFGIEGAVELIYFPLETVGSNGSVCTGNGSTLTATPTGNGPNKITTLGHTFTSGSAYISIKSLSAYVDGFYYTVGPTFTDLILTLASSDVSTQCNGHRNQATMINWADLNWPVPASAYNCQNRCGHANLEDQVAGTTPTQCSTIWSDVNPLLAIPTMITDLAPEFATCVLESNGNMANYWFDPPIALAQAAAMAVPTLSSQPSATPAMAGSSPVRPTPDSTAKFSVAGPTDTASEADPRPPSRVNDPGSSAAQTAQPTSTESWAPNDPSKSSQHSGAGVPGAEPTMQIHGSGSDADHSSENDPITFTPKPAAEPDAAPAALSVLIEALSTYSATPTIIGASATANNQPVDQNPELDPSSVFPSQPDASSGAFFSYDPAASDRPAATLIDDPSGVLGASALAFSTDPAGVIIVSASESVISATRPANSEENPPVASGGIGPVPDSTSAAFTTITKDPGSTLQPFTFVGSDAKGSSRTIIIDGQAVPSNSAVSFFGQTITHDSAGLGIVPAPTTGMVKATPIVLQAGDLTLTASSIAGSPNAIVVAGTTLMPDGPAATISGSVITQGSGGLLLVGLSSALAFTQSSQTSGTTTGNSVVIFALGSITMTATSDPDYVNGWLVDGTSLSYETGSVVVDGLTITNGWGPMQISGTKMSTVGGGKTATSLPFVLIPTSTSVARAPSRTTTEESAAATSDVVAESLAEKKWPESHIPMALAVMIMCIVV